MKHIERYLSAYVISCLFGHTDEEHMEYVYKVLRETGSDSSHPVLSKVLDYIRQGDPADPEIQGEVAEYVAAMLNRAKATRFEALYSIRQGMALFTVYENGGFVAFGMSIPSKVDEAIEELKKTYPGIVIRQV